MSNPGGWSAKAIGNFGSLELCTTVLEFVRPLMLLVKVSADQVAVEAP